jgi:pyrroloquinoline quinone biosynthesis protein B
MRIKVLGSAAGGGFPQWNCGCPNCSRFRSGSFKGGARTQAQVAVSPSPGNWILLNASPDLRQQLLSYPEFAPKGPRSTPIHSVILTSADTDCVLGLLHLREFQPLRIYATESVRRIVTEENSLFRTLERSSPPVRWETLPLDRPTPIAAGETASLDQSGSESAAGTALCCRAVSLDGEIPDYVSTTLRRSLRKEEAVVALELAEADKKFFFAPSLPGLGSGIKQHINEPQNRCIKLHMDQSQIWVLDGTFWTENELKNTRGEGKTAREIGHMPLSGDDGLLEQLRGAQATRRILIHLNNTNPVLDEDSPAYRAVREAGWEIAYDGMEFNL